MNEKFKKKTGIGPGIGTNNEVWHWRDYQWVEKVTILLLIKVMVDWAILVKLKFNYSTFLFHTFLSYKNYMGMNEFYIALFLYVSNRKYYAQKVFPTQIGLKLTDYNSWKYLLDRNKALFSCWRKSTIKSEIL